MIKNRALLLSYWTFRAVSSAVQCSVAEHNTPRKIKEKNKTNLKRE